MQKKNILNTAYGKFKQPLEKEFKGQVFKFGKGLNDFKYTPFTIDQEEYDQLQKYFEDKMIIKGFEINFIEQYFYDDKKSGGKNYYIRLGDYDIEQQQWVFSFSLAMKFDPDNLQQQPFMCSPTKIYHKIFIYDGSSTEFEVPTTLWRLYLEIVTFKHYVKAIAIECEGRTQHVHFQPNNKRKQDYKENDDDFQGNQPVKIIKKQEWNKLMNTIKQ